MGEFYILDGRDIRKVDIITWAKWFEKTERHVADDFVGDVRVSTVFLGINHNFGDGVPLLFETIVFDGQHDGEMKRYSTWQEAEDGHKTILTKIKEGKE